MARHKRKNPLLAVARQCLDLHAPDLHDTTLHLRSLDGPTGSPRYSVTAEACFATSCPYDVPSAVAQAGKCPVRDCPLRRSVRLLLDGHGGVVQVTRSTIHWN